MSLSETDVIVIGAGLSGLAVAHELKRRGVDVRVLDAKDKVGDTWRARHPQLTLNTHRRLSSLPGLLMSGSTGAFPTRDDVVAYLQDYRDLLGPIVEFGVTVRRVNQILGGWLVDSSTGPWVARHVIVATGHDAIPWIPDWPGRETFRGELLHASDFGVAERFRGRDVIVVGAGNSGSDVLNHLVEAGPRHLWVSIRHGPVVFPERLLGVPVQLLSPIFELLPVQIADRFLRLTQQIAFGNLAKHGLKSHPTGGASRLVGEGTAPAIDTGFVAALKCGDIEVVPEVAAFKGQSVRFADGTEVQPELVIAATGYRTGLEPLVGHLRVLNDAGVPRTNGAERDPPNPGLWFTGMRPRLSGFFRAAGRDGIAIARLIEHDIRGKQVSLQHDAGRLFAPSSRLQQSGLSHP
jgi:cation diffusion facilitator CzcD-associated flavoprotein CzcO